MNGDEQMASRDLSLADGGGIVDVPAREEMALQSISDIRYNP